MKFILNAPFQMGRFFHATLLKKIGDSPQQFIKSESFLNYFFILNELFFFFFLQNQILILKKCVELFLIIIIKKQTNLQNNNNIINNKNHMNKCRIYNQSSKIKQSCTFMNCLHNFHFHFFF